jgi:heptosyltransferase-1
MGYIKQYKFEKLLLLPIKLRLGRRKKLSDINVTAKPLHFIIFYGGAIGDCILATYFIASLKKQFPNSKVTFISIPAAVKLLSCFNEIEFVFRSGIFSIRKFSHLFSAQVWRDFRKEFVEITRHTKSIKDLKVLISLTRMDSLFGVYKTKIISSLIKCDYSIGLNSNNGRGAYFDHMIDDPGNLVEHMTTTWNKVIEHLIGVTNKVNYDLKCTVKDEVWQGRRFDFGEKYCVIHTGGGSDANEGKWVNKRWAISNFYETANWIIERYNCKIVFIGTLGEKDPSFDVQNNPNYIDMYGKTSLPELIPILTKAYFYVGNDSGLAHLASYTGVESFVLWSYASYIDYAPVSPSTELIRLDLPCAPCLHIFDNRLCKNTSWEFKCIRDIEVDYLRGRITSALNNTQIKN